MEVVEIISQKAYVDAPADVVKMSMAGSFQYAPKEPALPMPDFNVFHRYAANFPWRSHAVWYLTQMVRWGQIEPPVNFAETAEAVFRTDIYRAAAKELGVAYPDRGLEVRRHPRRALDAGRRHAAHRDGTGPLPGRPRLRPGQAMDYLRSFEVSKLKIDMAALAEANV